MSEPSGFRETSEPVRASGEGRLCASPCQPAWGVLGSVGRPHWQHQTRPVHESTAPRTLRIAAPLRPVLARPATGGAGSTFDGHRAPGAWAGYSPLRARHSVRCLFFCGGDAVLAAGRWAHRAGGGLGNKVPLGGLENKERKMPKTKGRFGAHGPRSCSPKRELGQRRGTDVCFRG